MGLLDYEEKKKKSSGFGINDFVDGMQRIQEHFFNPKKSNWKIWQNKGLMKELGVTEAMVDKFLRTPIAAIKHAHENPTDAVLESFEETYGWPLNVNDPNLRKHAENDFKDIGHAPAAFGTDWLIEGDDDIDIEMGDTWEWRTVNAPIYPEESGNPNITYEKRRVRRPRPTSYTTDNYIYGRPPYPGTLSTRFKRK